MLSIWPEHCLIGSTGHCVVKDVRGETTTSSWTSFNVILHHPILYITNPDYLTKNYTA